MTTVMTIAAGVAVGYLIFQFFSSSSRGMTNGRLHKSSRDKKICGVCGCGKDRCNQSTMQTNMNSHTACTHFSPAAMAARRLTIS